MKVISVNVSLPKTVRFHGQSVRTGIYKEPVTGAIPFGALGLEGDGQADHRYHGGPDKALYLYPAEHYPYWRKSLGRDLPFGTFGENLTVEGAPEDAVRIGDVLELEDGARLQVTQPRTPCGKLGMKMGSLRFIKTFLAAGRPGYYLRVLKEGHVEAGDTMRRIATDTTRPTVAEAFGS